MLARVFRRSTCEPVCVVCYIRFFGSCAIVSGARDICCSNLCVCVWACGRVGVWACGRVGVWVGGRLGVWGLLSLLLPAEPRALVLPPPLYIVFSELNESYLTLTEATPSAAKGVAVSTLNVLLG
jgi:hypothetical protein